MGLRQRFLSGSRYKSTPYNHGCSLSNIDVARDHEEAEVEEEPSGTERYDVIYENQRGLYLFGIPKFNSKVLFPTDPPAWYDGYNFALTDIHSYQLPDPSWEWVYEHWCIDMSDDVDEEGWQYSVSFGRPWWHGAHRVWKAFVRRRRWIRLRRKRGTIQLPQPNSQKSPTELAIPETTIAEVDDDHHYHRNSAQLLDRLQKVKTDRQRLDIVREWIDSGHHGVSVVEAHVPHILHLLEYEISKLQCTQLLESYHITPAKYKHILQRPAFFSDLKQLGGLLDPTSPLSRTQTRH
ncbi:hypothetical protein IWQ61_008878 [Dispira simplex]|nr:hypothetical protein IWQ61_008878 [Dispira simplex]